MLVETLHCWQIKVVTRASMIFRDNRDKSKVNNKKRLEFLITVLLPGVNRTPHHEKFIK
jgi:hypothetical protein